MTAFTALVFLVLPAQASALTFVQFVGLFHVAVGLLLIATLMLFVVSFCVYVARFNTWPTHRDASIRGLEWSVVMLFVLVLLLALARFFQFHSTIALPILAFIIIVVIAIIIVRMAAAKKEKPPARPGR